jgi:hypothetical protein
MCGFTTLRPVPMPIPDHDLVELFRTFLGQRIHEGVVGRSSTVGASCGELVALAVPEEYLGVGQSALAAVSPCHR